MVGNTRSAPSDDRLRRVELITDRRPLKTILASLKVRLRSALRLSGFGTAIHSYGTRDARVNPSMLGAVARMSTRSANRNISDRRLITGNF